MTRPTGSSSGRGATGRSMNCAWPPSRCGATTRRRATAFATSLPWSSRTRWRQRSIPAALPRRRQDIAVVGVQDAGIDAHLPEAALQRLGVAPVRRRPAPVEQAPGGEREGARADRDEPRAGAVRGPQGVEHGGRRIHVDASGGHDHRAGAAQGVEPVGDVDDEAADRSQRARPLRADHELVPRHDELGAREPEDLDDHAELEGRHPVVGENRDAVRRVRRPAHRGRPAGPARAAAARVAALRRRERRRPRGSRRRRAARWRCAATRGSSRRG